MITRYELKYRISLQQRARFLQAAREYLRPDHHADGEARYWVNSLYFDTAELDAYWEKVDGQSVRRKLRLRYYGQQHQRPTPTVCFLEIKNRVRDCVHKQRTVLANDQTAMLWREPTRLNEVAEQLSQGPAPAKRVIGEQILRLSVRRPYLAANFVRYRREAWMGAADERLRITFDDRVTAQDPDCLSAAPAAAGAPLLPENECLLEIKLNQAAPRWIRDLVVSQQLAPRRFSKYATGIEQVRVAASCK